MAWRIEWDKTGEKTYRTGTDRGVLYPMASDGGYETGVAWNGLTKVSTSSEGGDSNALYADNIKYLNLVGNEDKKATIGCYTYPDEWDACNGVKSAGDAVGLYVGQQTRKKFGFCWRTLIGNDTEGTDYGYELHLLYNGTAAPSDEESETVNQDPSAIEFSYEVNTEPINVPIDGFKPCAIFTVKSTDFTNENQSRLTNLENVLYGTAGTSAYPRLPAIAEVISILSGSSPSIVTVSITQGDDTTLAVTNNATSAPISNGDTIAVGAKIGVSVTGGTVTVVGATEDTPGSGVYTVTGAVTITSVKSGG